jgi:large subunit ribosomal protein L5
VNKNNVMRTLKMAKITVHIGVGESGEHLNNAQNILNTITRQAGVRSKAKRTLQTFNIKKHEPIGCKVTLRGDLAEYFMRTSLAINENRLSESQFDNTGNFSYGIEEHTDFPDMKYDPNIGIFGMDISVSLVRPGYRISKRKIQKHKISNNHRVTKEDAITFVKDSYGVEVLS